MDLSSRESHPSSAVYPTRHSQSYTQQQIPLKTEEQVIDPGPRRRSQLYPSRHLPHPSLTSPGYANHTLPLASGVHHQGYGDTLSRPHVSLPPGHSIGASGSSGRQSFHSQCSSCDYDHPPPPAVPQGLLHIQHPSVYSQYLAAPQTRYDLRNSASHPSSALLPPLAGPSHPLRPPLLHLASSGLEFEERAIRSPHPPLTATFHQGDPRLWPAQGPSRTAHFGVAPSSAELERPFYSSPIAPDFDPRQAHYYRPEAQLPYPSAPPHLPPLSTALNDHLASPVLIPPPLKFSYSNSPPPLSAPLPTYHEPLTMPPRKKTGLATSSGRPTPANSQTTASSTARSRKTFKGNGWTVEQTYDSTGRQKDVIVIDDSESPGRVPRKRTRAQVAAGQTNGHSVNGSTASVAGSTKKRKVEPSESGVAKKAKAKASGTAASNHVNTALQPKQVVSAAQGSSSSSHPPWDDPEGHYIVKPDDVIANKYKIVRLLGQGTFGKVVEARHLETRKKVAIKVIRAVQKYRDASKIEIRVLEALKRNDPNNFNNCIHLVEYFDFRSHPCLVSELYGKSVFDFLKENSFSPFPERHIQDFAKSLLKSVDFLHRLRLVHTDLKPENILLVSNEARQNGPRVKGSKARNILRNTDIRLIDFGSATFENEYHSSVVSTRHYRAPEIILGLPWSYPCDLFSIGCILVEFYTGEALFQTHDNLEHLGMMEVVMGKIPPRIVERGRIKKPEFFKGRGIDFPNATVSRQSRKFVKQMRSMPEIIPPNTPHNKLFLDLIVRLLDFDPESRITVSQALRHPYCSLNIDPPP